MRDSYVETLVVAFTAGGLGAAMAIMMSKGFASQDVFAFSGALVGAAASVAGAAWTADRAVTREQRREQSLVAQDLDALLDTATVALARHPGSGAWTDSWRSSIYALGDVAGGSGRFLDEVIAYAKTFDFYQRGAIRDLRAALCDFMRFYEDVFESQEELHPLDERTWPAVINRLTEATQQALHTLRVR